MGTPRNDGWETNSATYTEEQVEGVLNTLGLYVEGSTWSEFLLHCPIHGGRDTPSFAVQKTSGVYFCFNPACNETGTLLMLVKNIQRCNDYEAARLILTQGKATTLSPAERIKKALERPEEFPTFSQEVLDKMHSHYKVSELAQEYMKSRGFEEETMDHFRIGYSAKQDLITVPMHDPNGNPVGVIGRRPSREDKRFKNSKNLPTSKTIFNYHRAKRASDTLIVVEASFDVMRVHQAGYPNAGGLLMGHFSEAHEELINRSFKRIIIMTDMDKKQFYPNCRRCLKTGLNLCRGHNPGRVLGRKIADTMRNKEILWASYEPGVIFPNGGKDPGDCTDREIAQCIKNAVPTIEYNQWGLDS